MVKNDTYTKDTHVWSCEFWKATAAPDETFSAPDVDAHGEVRAEMSLRMGLLGPGGRPVLLPVQSNPATDWMGAKDEPHLCAEETEMAYQDHGTCLQLT